MGDIVLFGATGYTGRLVAAALVRRGARPVLAARSQGPLDDLARELGGLETRTADVTRPETVRALVAPGDVLVSTVGPFVRFGEPAVAAAVDAGIPYIDSTGETPFIREVFERHGPAAARTGASLVTAFGYDWVPGNLAGALALEDAGAAAVRLDIGYFLTGGGAGMSGGTRASTAGVMLEPSYTFADGAIRTERAASRLRTFDVRGRERPAVSVGTTEAFSLPRLAPGLQAVDVHLGWFGGASRAMQGLSLGGSLLTKLPGAKRAAGAVTGRFVKGSTGGPDEAARAGTGSHAVAIASDAAGAPVATVHVEGPNGYDLTAELLAWGATAALDGALAEGGAFGPADGFGLERLRAGCAEAGLHRI